MNKTVYWAAGVLLVAGLAGCGGVPAITVEVIAPQSEPEPTESATPDARSPEQEFVTAITPAWRGALPTDNEIVALGTAACNAVSKGAEWVDVAVVSGTEDDAWNNAELVSAAWSILCPELAP